jgi:hypothetical protein
MTRKSIASIVQAAAQTAQPRRLVQPAPKRMKGGSVLAKVVLCEMEYYQRPRPQRKDLVLRTCLSVILILRFVRHVATKDQHCPLCQLELLVKRHSSEIQTRVLEQLTRVARAKP